MVHRRMNRTQPRPLGDGVQLPSAHRTIPKVLSLSLLLSNPLSSVTGAFPETPLAPQHCKSQPRMGVTVLCSLSAFPFSELGLGCHCTMCVPIGHNHAHVPLGASTQHQAGLALGALPFPQLGINLGGSRFENPLWSAKDPAPPWHNKGQPWLGSEGVRTGQDPRPASSPMLCL